MTDDEFMYLVNDGINDRSMRDITPKADALLDIAHQQPLPKLGNHNSHAWVVKIAAELRAAGMPRTSYLNGATISGYTTAYGSTGFSIRDQRDGTLAVHVVASGKACGLGYETDSWDEDDDGHHRPIDMESLHPRIRAVFTNLGLDVRDVANGGYQTSWDDDVTYTVVISDPR